MRKLLGLSATMLAVAFLAAGCTSTPKAQQADSTASNVVDADEQVLKQETVQLARRRPFLILENLLVKLVVVLFYCICATNVGLYAAKLARKPIWFEYVCAEGNHHVVVGRENYFVSDDGFLMPTRKGQSPPDLKFFNQAPK